MRRFLLLSGCLLAFLPALARSEDESLPATVVANVKRAAVYIRVQDSTWKGSGSGFVVSVKGDTALIATNFHVLGGATLEKKPNPSPKEVIQMMKAPTVTVIFDSGLKTERALKAEAVTADADKDLAILRVSGLKDPPPPIEYASPLKLTETMAVYTFGYPFGQALSTSKGSPAVTVGKASISSIRLDDNGDMAYVQIDGALNPGNSGGPVVDAKGKLVGVAVATIKEGKGIGLAIPAIELGKMMEGRLGTPFTSTTKTADGKVKVKVEVGILDPTGAITGAKLHYLTVDAKGTKPKDPELLEKRAGVRNLTLTVDGGVASGEFTLDSSADQLYVQAVPDSRAKISPTSIQMVSTAVTSSALVGEGGKPPAGWKEYTPQDHSFIVWLPEKTKRQSESTRNSRISTQTIRVTVLNVEVTAGLTYQVQRLTLPLSMTARGKRKEIEEALRDSLLSEVKGKVKDEADVKLGSIPGKEYFIESGRTFIRMRLFVSSLGNRVYTLLAIGTEEELKSAATSTFFDSCRLPATGTPESGAGGGDVVAAAPKGKGIQGGSNNDSEFKEVAPDGGFLVGFELGAGKYFNNDVLKSLRPVYRVGDKDSLGKQRGAEPTSPVKVIAKPGYAVGGITVRAGLVLEGFSVTFMKIDGNKLNPKDSYESEWVGGKGPGTGKVVSLAGDGVPVVGVIGRTNPKEITGFGILQDTPKK